MAALSRFRKSVAGLIWLATISGAHAQTNPSPTFQNLIVLGTVTGPGFSAFLTSTPPYQAAHFQTLTVDGLVSGSGFLTYLSSPPCIGCTAPGPGAFTALTANTIAGTWTGAPINLQTQTTGNLSAANLNGGLGANNTTFLRGDMTWATPPVGGGGGGGGVATVTWVGGIISIANPTTTPAFTIAGNSGGLVYFNSATTWNSSPTLGLNGVLIGGGLAGAPTAIAVGITNQVLHGTTGGAPLFGPISVADLFPTCVSGQVFFNNAGSIGCTSTSGGSVTSVGFTGGLLSVATPTTTPALTVAGTSGGIPYFNSGTTWASSTALVASSIVLGGGAGAAPSTPLGLGTTTAVLHGNAAGNPAWAAISAADIATAVSGPLVLPGNVDINNQGADGGTLFSTVGYGFPPQKSGFFTSGSNFQALRYISTYFSQSALYATTTLGSASGETGLYITFSDVTGYQNPTGATGGQKTAIQVSGSCGSGGGVCWDEAESLQWLSGWIGGSGNFSAVHEIDPGPNNAGATIPTGGSLTSIFGLWVAGVIGSNPISAMIQISPAGTNGAVFASHYAINVGGTTVADLADLNTSSSATNGYVDTGIHSGYAEVLQGTYSTAGITITGTMPTGINVSGLNISTADFTTNSHATNSIVDSGTHANGIVLQGTYSTTALTATGAIATTGVFSNNGHNGVTCSGTPTPSFASFGGIVTHC
jgi:hypothetical protein